MSLTPGVITVSLGSAVNVREGSFEIDDSISSISTCMFIVRDDSGTNHYTKGQPVSVTDSVNGTLYTGFVSAVIEDRASPNTLIFSQVSCRDNHYLAEKRTYAGPEYTTPTYAGAIATGLLSTLAAEGVTAQYASDRDTTQADFSAGTLSGVVATNNVGDGDLELSLAGSPVTITESTTSDFGTGSLSDCTAANNTLAPTATPAIMLQGTMSVPGSGNDYVYIKVWSGSSALATNDVISYSIWIASTSPAFTCGVDFVCSDGTNFRDFGAGSIQDAQGIGCHPKNDLSGLAKDAWYSRSFTVPSGLNGKTLAYVTVVLEGDSEGTYTCYIRNIKQTGGVNTNFFTTSLNLNPPVTLGDNGYSNVSVQVVNTYDASGIQRISSATSVSAVALLRSSFISWTANEPAGTQFVMKYSIDGGATFWQCTNNAPLPFLPAGTKLATLSIQLAEQFTISGPDPTVFASLSSVSCSLVPSYAATKSDVLFEVATGAGWASNGTLTNTANINNNDLTLNGYVRDWDNADLSGMTIFGSNVPSKSMLNKQAQLGTGTGTDVRARLDFVGNWQDFTCEVDILLITGAVDQGIAYRTTNWGNANDSYAYAASVNTTSVKLGHGTNSTGAGAFTLISSVAVTLTAGNTYHMKVVVSGSNHKIYIDDVLYVNATDATYGAAGGVALRFYNNAGIAQGAQFDNFGIAATLSGTWQSNSQSLTAASTYGTSVILWRDVSVNPDSTTLLVQTSINGGSTFQTATNGGAIPNLTPGQSLSGVNLIVKITLTAGSIVSLPGVDNLVVRVLGGFSSSGNRISPALSLANVGRLGNSLIAWNANLPAGCTLGVDTRIDAGSWTDQTAQNGLAVAGLTVQPDPYVDTFVATGSTSYVIRAFGSTLVIASDSHANFISTCFNGGSAGTWTFDTTNSRVIASGGTNAVERYDGLVFADGYVEVDMDVADTAGPGLRFMDQSNLYYLKIRDDTAGAPANTIQLFKNVAGIKSQIGGNASISFVRGTVHRIRFQIVGSSITVNFDGVQVISATDSSVAGPGEAFMYQNSLAQFYSIRVQPLGQDVTAHTVQYRLRLASTDPTVTPQVLDATLAAYGNTIGKGALIPSTSYFHKYISANFDDLVKQNSSATNSQWWWYIDKNKIFSILPQMALPSPWVGTDTPGDFLDAGLTVEDASDLYRNRQIIENVLATVSVNEDRLGDGVSQSWTFGNQWASAPTITVNGIAASVGIKNIDTGRDFYYAVGDATITEDSSGPIYDQTFLLNFQGTGQYLTYSQADDTAGQTAMAARDGTSGIVENVEDGTGLTKAQGDALASARLAQYSRFGKTLKATTRRYGLAPGQIFTVFLPEHNLFDTPMLIRSVKTRLTTEGPTGAMVQQCWFAIEAISGPDIGDWTKMYQRN